MRRIRHYCMFQFTAGIAWLLCVTEGQYELSSTLWPLAVAGAGLLAGVIATDSQ
jgi:hypothetical protein